MCSSVCSPTLASELESSSIREVQADLARHQRAEGLLLGHAVTAASFSDSEDLVGQLKILSANITALSKRLNSLKLQGGSDRSEGFSTGPKKLNCTRSPHQILSPCPGAELQLNYSRAFNLAANLRGGEASTRRLNRVASKSLEAKRGGVERNVNFLVLGTSMTAGVGCKPPRGKISKSGACFLGGGGLLCAWPNRFAQFYSRSTPNLNVCNAALRGSSSKLFAKLGTRNHIAAVCGAATSFDLVILDFSVSDTNVEDRPSIELVIRELWELPSKPAIVQLVTLPGENRMQTLHGSPSESIAFPVSTHYGISVVSFSAVAHDQASGKLIPEVGGGFGHPPWPVHHYVASVMIHWWEAVLNATASLSCSTNKNSPFVGSSSVVDPGLPPRLFAHGAARAGTCSSRPRLMSLHPHSTEGAHVANNSRGWRVYDDTEKEGVDFSLQKRIGWIATIPGATLTVRFNTTSDGAVGIVFLKSYRGMGAVTVRVDGMCDKTSRTGFQGGSCVLNALWKEGLSVPDLWEARHLPRGEHVLTLELLSAQPSSNNRRKFKVMEVHSC